jgi:hypothetical protein
MPGQVAGLGATLGDDAAAGAESVDAAGALLLGFMIRTTAHHLSM